MNIIKVISWDDVPKNFTGIAEFGNGNKYWFKEGFYHREDGPAIESLDGTREWLKEGKRHRIDGPAVVCGNGSKYWYIEGCAYLWPWLQFLIEDSIYLEKEQKGKYDLNWLSFLTDQGIKEFPIIPGMEEDSDFIPLFNKVFGTRSK